MTEEAHVVVSARRTGGDVPFVDLDPAHFKLLPGFDARFSSGPPSLVECERFVVRGDVTFGGGVFARGVVDVVNDGDEQLVVGDGSVLSGE